MTTKRSTSSSIARVVGPLLVTSNAKDRKRLIAKLQTIVRERAERLRTYYNVKGYQHWESMDIVSLEDQLHALFGQEQFLRLLRRPTRIALDQGQSFECLYSTKHKRLIKALALNDTIKFVNPYIDHSQSWSRLTFDQPKYHNPGTPDDNKSKFLKGIKVNEVLKIAFRAPVGRLLDENEIQLYCRFDGDIGNLAKRGGTTRIIRVHLDRIPRNTGDGYQTRVHGYPLSEGELQRDLQGCGGVDAYLEDQPIAACS
jgi:hypothetical protein